MIPVQPDTKYDPKLHSEIVDHFHALLRERWPGEVLPSPITTFTLWQTLISDLDDDEYSDDHVLVQLEDVMFSRKSTKPYFLKKERKTS